MIKAYKNINYWLSKLGDNFDKGGWGKIYSVIGYPNLIIKITSDFTEYKSAKKLLNKNTDYIVNYYFVSKYENKYLLVMERINIKIKKEYKEILDDLNVYCYYYDEDLYFKTIFNEKDNIIEDFSDKFKKNNVTFVINNLIEIVKECKKNNIYTNDFHSGNIGIKNKHLIFFDVGVTK